MQTHGAGRKRIFALRIDCSASSGLGAIQLRIAFSKWFWGVDGFVETPSPCIMIQIRVMTASRDMSRGGGTCLARGGSPFLACSFNPFNFFDNVAWKLIILKVEVFYTEDGSRSGRYFNAQKNMTWNRRCTENSDLSIHLLIS